MADVQLVQFGNLFHRDHVTVGKPVPGMNAQSERHRLATAFNQLLKLDFPLGVGLGVGVGSGVQLDCDRADFLRCGYLGGIGVDEHGHGNPGPAQFPDGVL